VFGTSTLRVELTGNTFYFFAIDSKGNPYREEYCALEIQGVSKGILSSKADPADNDVGPIDVETRITGFEHVEYRNDNRFVLFNTTLSNGGKFAIWFELTETQFVTSLKLLCQA